ncbi:Methyltransferase domain-containing protein [Arthrobacter alpinus]|uniref:Methyltransferase domain-containing protein n=1 Tax=Arthrobacter alpinus TaxID=656366 RepID=A0A1H5F3X5_9MICC|nr:class I SAM-dependent methyltransferase [Arthrobacter alpinus]SED98147.1 Methyltransferase domain-containing protein [Arthrobacter alpinus]
MDAAEDRPAGGGPAFLGKVVVAATGFAELASIAMGDKLGWYRALNDAGSAGLSSDELAENTATNPRYVQEWLEQQAVAGLLTASRQSEDDAPEEPGGSFRFNLPPGAAAALVDDDSLDNLAPMVRMLMAGLANFPELLAAYRNGGGVPWSVVGDEARDSQARGNKAWFETRLGTALAGVGDVHAILARAGARILDLGAGYGWSTLALAKAYPGAVVVGIDIDEPSIVRARDHARERGMAGQVSFEHADAAGWQSPDSADAVFIFEALHDMPFPVSVLQSIRRMVKPDGVVVVMDEAVADSFDPPGDELERLMYAYSLLICLPDSLSTPGSVGTGTVMRPSTLERYAMEAGFSRVAKLPIEDFSFFRFYRLFI